MLEVRAVDVNRMGLSPRERLGEWLWCAFQDSAHTLGHELMELDHSVYPALPYIPTARGEKAKRGECLSCHTKWSAAEPISCPACAISWPDPIADRLRDSSL